MLYNLEARIFQIAPEDFKLHKVTITFARKLLTITAGVRGEEYASWA